jgi:hypothetical protein
MYLLSTVINVVAFCIVLLTPTLHVYVPASLAASGLNVSVLVLPMVDTISDRTASSIGSNQVMSIVDWFDKESVVLTEHFRLYTSPAVSAPEEVKTTVTSTILVERVYQNCDQVRITPYSHRHTQ